MKIVNVMLYQMQPLFIASYSVILIPWTGYLFLSHFLNYYYCIRLTAFYQDNPG